MLVIQVLGPTLKVPVGLLCDGAARWIATAVCLRLIERTLARASIQFSESPNLTAVWAHRMGQVRFDRISAGPIVADQGEEDALNDEFAGRDEIRIGGVFCFQVGATGLDHVTFEGSFAIDEGGDDVIAAWFFDFHDDVVAIENVSIDHGIPADAKGEGAGGLGDTQGIDVDGNGAFLFGFDIGGVTGWDCAEDRDVEDFRAVEVFRKDDSTSHIGVPLDDAFFLERAQVAHGGGLAGKAEVPLDFPSGRHHAVFALVLPEKVEQLALPVRERDLGIGKHGCS